MTTTYGTNHFLSLAAAVNYYHAYHYPNTLKAVERKLAEGEIAIERPTLKPGQTLSLIDDGTRYAITEQESKP